MHKKELSDEDLVNSLSKGSEEAITEIYHRYWRKLLAIAYNQTKDKVAAEEIVQEVLIKLWDRRTELQIQSLSGYLAVSVKYSVYNSIQRQQRREEIAHTALANQNEDQSEQKIYTRFLSEYIDSVVDKLPDKCKLVFRYSRNEGRNNAEIASELQISEKTVEAHITKAIKSIRFSLKNAGTYYSLLLVIFLLK